MSSHTEFQLHKMFLALDIDPTTPNINTVLHTTKSLNHENMINRLNKQHCAYLILVSDEGS